jgi:hypothetical protein
MHNTEKSDKFLEESLEEAEHQLRQNSHLAQSFLKELQTSCAAQIVGGHPKAFMVLTRGAAS